MGRITLCLTGTIVPATSLVHRRDVGLRLADYKSAIGFYLEQTVLPIVFAENSDYDLESDADFVRWINHPRFRLLRIPAHADTSKGKGFQEFHLLDRVLETGYLGSRFAKLTGRYRVRNVEQLIQRSEAPLHIDLHKKMKVALTGFFISDADIYQTFFKDVYLDANDDEGRYIEHVLYNKIIGDPELYQHSSLLPMNPQYEGFSGSYGGSLKRHPTKMMVRGWERSINRSLGIHQFLIEY